MPVRHIPVLLDEVVSLLSPQPGQNFIDCTLGGGGHAAEILKKTAPDGKMLALDLDAEAIESAKNELKSFTNRLTIVNDNFAKLKQIYNEQFTVHKVDGILLDLGLSTLELEDGDRGFSFQIDAPLDMRFDKRQSLTAAEIVNTWPFDKLKRIIQEYGQERLAHAITNKIIQARLNKKLTKTKNLVEAILLAFRDKLKSKKDVPWIGGLHPATRTFQALRMAVNGELDNLHKVLPQAVELLSSGGRLAVISFHSLEDRIVKDYFRQEARGCLCPPVLPECRCGHKARLKIITKKPVRPSPEEIKTNSRASSAKLRVVSKI